MIMLIIYKNNKSEINNDAGTFRKTNHRVRFCRFTDLFQQPWGVKSVEILTDHLTGLIVNRVAGWIHKSFYGNLNFP